MPTNFLKGDILDEVAAESGKRALAFGAGSGIAAAVRKRWPAFAEAVDSQKGEGAKRLEPGEIFEWHEGELFIFVLGVQRDESKPKMSWIERSLRAVVARAVEEEISRVLIARLTGDWTRVKKVLGEVGSSTTIDLVVFEQFVRKSAT